METPEGRRKSEVLDAIFDKVAEPKRDGPAITLYRAKALEQLDIPAEVDTRLPLVSRRSWLLLIGVGLLIAALLIWAGLTPSVTSTNAQGRVVAAPGAVPIGAPVPGVVASRAPAGAVLEPGDVAATISTATGVEELAAPVAGTVWQELAVPGTSVVAGQSVVTLLPPGSADQAMLVVAEGDAAGMAPGLEVQVTSLGMTEGSIVAISAPTDARSAGQSTGLVLPDTTTYLLVTVDLATPMPPGAVANGTVILSEGTVLTRLLGRT